MRDELLAGPGEIAAAWKAAQRFDLAPKYADIFSVAVLGAGAAGAAAAMLQAMVAHTAQIPVVVVLGEELPAFVGPDTLVIACVPDSDADTEDDIALAFEEAADRGGKLVVVAAGEAWAARAVSHRAPLLALPPMLTAAATMIAPFAPAPSLVALLGVLHAAGVIANPDRDVTEALAALAALHDVSGEPSDDIAAPNLAQGVARHIAGRAVAVQGLGMLAPAAAWGRATLADSARVLTLPDDYGVSETLPRSAAQTAVIALRSLHDPPRLLARARAAATAWEGAGVASVAVPVGSSTRLGGTLWTLGFLGWIAHYLSAE